MHPPATAPPNPVSRTRLHTRRLSYEGFQRSDGLFEIEAALTDIKDQDYALLTGTRPAGEPVHAMRVRIAFDVAGIIQDVDASFERMPYPGACAAIAPDYRRLLGLNLLRGFRRALRETMGGVQGCSHVTEMLGGVPTAAIQTFSGLRSELAHGEGDQPFQLDHCHALKTDSHTVRRYYPKWYRAAPVSTPRTEPT